MKCLDRKREPVAGNSDHIYMVSNFELRCSASLGDVEKDGAES